MSNSPHNFRDILAKNKVLAEEEFQKRLARVSPPVVYGMFVYEDEYKAIPFQIRKAFNQMVDAHASFEREETAPGITILGEPGIGKTKAVFALAYHLLAKYWLTKKNFSTAFEPKIIEHIDWVQAVRKVCRPYFEGQEVAAQFIADVEAWPGVLFLDDVGAAAMPDFISEYFYKLIDNRLKSWRPTVLISNATPEQLGEALDPRISDRLRRWTKIINFQI